MNFVFFDTEDNSPEMMLAGTPRDKKVTQICAKSWPDGDCYYAGNRAGVDPDQFIKWLLTLSAKQKGKLRVYAHNLQYDQGNIGRNRLDSFDVVLVGSRMIRAALAKLTFLDTFNLWPMSLAKIGAAFGIQKGALDPYSRQYVETDVDIGIAAVRHAQETAELFGVNLPSTLGGLCVRIWRAMGGESWFCDSMSAHSALFGGRIELFRAGGPGEICWVDINSLYPSAMLEKFPTELAPMADIPEYGIAEVTLKIPEQMLAPLPFRRKDASIIFPVGRVRGTWTAHEIRNACEKHGAQIDRLWFAAGSNSGESYYAEFAKRIYARRRAAGTDAERTFLKLLLNNLYGQVAMSGKITRSIQISRQDFNAQRTRGTPYGSKQLVNFQVPLGEHTNYLHGAYITSYGRLALLDHLRKIPQSDLIYCDTDSVIFYRNLNDPLPFPTGDALGIMKVEKWQETVCFAFAQKSYCYGGDVKTKGVPRRLAAEFLLNNQASYDLPYKFREAALFYDQGNSRPLSVWRRVVKRNRAKYDKKTCQNGVYSPVKLR